MAYKNAVKHAKTKNISDPVLSNQFGGSDSKQTSVNCIKTVHRRRSCRPYFLSGVYLGLPATLKFYTDRI
jgi:hypothetical protein